MLDITDKRMLETTNFCNFNTAYSHVGVFIDVCEAEKTGLQLFL